MQPVGVLLVFVALSLAVVRVTQRVRHATLLTRRMIIPVAAVGATRAGAVGVALVARQLDATTQALNVVSWLLALAVPVMALAFLAGLLRWRLFAGVALQRLSGCLRTVPGRADAATGVRRLVRRPVDRDRLPEPRRRRVDRRPWPPGGAAQARQWTRLERGAQR